MLKITRIKIWTFKSIYLVSKSIRNEFKNTINSNKQNSDEFGTIKRNKVIFIQK